VTGVIEDVRLHGEGAAVSGAVLHGGLDAQRGGGGGY